MTQPQVDHQARTQVDHQARTQSRPLAGRWLSAVFPILLAACAADAWQSEKPFDQFLSQVQNECQYKKIGRLEINSDTFADMYFLDLTSRVYNGQITRNNYEFALSGTYDAGPNDPGLVCLLNLIPKPRTPIEM